MKTLVCPIAYNENVKLRRAIERFLKSPSAADCDYLVLDDGSTDGTTAMIEDFSAQGVKTLRHARRRGVGAAIRSAIRYAQTHDYEVIVIMAGNDKDDPQEIPALLAPIEAGQGDIVQGSRYLGGARVGGDMPFYRKLATRAHPFLFSLLTRHRMTDTTNGFRAMRLAVFADPRLNLDQEWLETYELEPYILYKAVVLGYRVREAAVTKIYPARQLGYTKMKPIVGWWSILRPLFYLALGIKK